MIPPLALIAFATFKVSVVITVDWIFPKTLSVCPSGTVKPPFAVITPDILAVPRISREALGAELPIPILALVPPNIYILL